MHQYLLHAHPLSCIVRFSSRFVAPKIDLNWFVNKGADGLWVVTNVETGRTVATPAFGDTMKAAIGFAESEISKPENLKRMKEIALPKKPVAPITPHAAGAWLNVSANAFPASTTEVMVV